MRFVNLYLLFLLTMPMIAIGQKEDLKTIPLIDREVFFGNPEIAGGQLSPDGKYISFLKEYNGIMNIWVKQFDEPFSSAKPMSNNERPIGGYFWTDDSKYILYVKDSAGDENYHIYAVDPKGKVGEGGVPTARDLTPLEKVRARIFMVSENDPNMMMIGLNDRDPAFHDLYKLNIRTGELELLYENTDRLDYWIFDWDEKMRMAGRTLENGNSQLIRINEDKSFTPIIETNTAEYASPQGWTKDNKKVYISTNKGDDVNIASLFLLDMETLKMEFVEKDPMNRVDFGGLSMSNKNREIIYTTYTDSKQRIYWKNDEYAKAYAFLESKFPGREISLNSSTKDEDKYLVSLSGDKYVSESYFFDMKTRELIYQYTPRPELKKYESSLCEMTPITYPSSDGLEIPAYLTMPKVKGEGKVPLVMLIHGGPWARDYWGYNSLAQFLANRGFAVLQPNFRGSTGYGKEFLSAGNMQWGMLMQDDITWGVKHMVDKGLVDPEKVAIMGGSYGGYATLAGVTYTPDVYACGVDIVGPSNLFTLLESVPAYWESFLQTLYDRMGDPNTEEGREILRKESPLFFADQIKSPLMIVQGANDPRVKQAESDQIVIALRDMGTDVEYILAEDEGHGFRKPVNNMAMYAAVEKFMAQYCGTRYQEDMTEEIANRLKEMQQDVSKVTYVPAETLEVPMELPPMENRLAKESLEYKMDIAVNGQNIAASMVRTISKDGSAWKVEDVTSSPMGKSENVVRLDDMKAVESLIKEGGQEIAIEYSKEKLVAKMMGREMETKIDGAFIAAGPSMDLAICAMPLEKGFTSAFYSFDLMTQKVQTMKLVVEGETDQAYTVKVYELGNIKNQMIFTVDKKTRKLIEKVTHLPAMGNLVVKAVLVQ